ncbi:Cas10/Cmr2 second palm domain-containing protein [Parabacteroides pacaensis]|uniref:Cas10/Cmr2 second palm domain-containing protein n=1 Tax=Parabacteroides pacaensis TaxID=2086575 RepID=UPI000D0F1FE7|nr:type III-B CRISPR-associated protein Cas10/Cmr2 [Parabacteroides pacaensis]
MKYTAINIGPIIKTLSWAKRPRELWSVSYLFSYLMQCIIESIPLSKNEESLGVSIISPALLDGKSDKTVGLYPDRVFIKGEIDENSIIEKALSLFAEKTQLSSGNIKKYFNVMSISVDKLSDKEAIAELNTYLNYAELNNRAIEDNAQKELLELIRKKYNSSLFKLAFEKSHFKIPTLAEIATYSLSQENESQWLDICEHSKIIEEIEEILPEEYRTVDEDKFYTFIKEDFKKEYKSYHKYVCIVQADGDNMGTIVSNVQDGNVATLSKRLLDFGTEACRLIRNFGGLPIYAGGDDLLFIAPVTSTTDKNIFSLIAEIDDVYKNGVKSNGKIVWKGIKETVDEMNLKDNKGKPLSTAMSYGISINYYKFPLYEALKSARDLLFEKAKKEDKKDAVAWSLQKHSGATFGGAFSKTREELYHAFQKIINISSDEKLVSAVAHKIRANEELLSLWLGKSAEHIDIRLTAFFEKIIDVDNKNDADREYITTIRNLLTILYKSQEKEKVEDCKEKKNVISDIVLQTYGILKTAKFVNGERDNEE